MKVLIFGKRGQVGGALLRAFKDHDVVAFSRQELDLTQADLIKSAITQHSPDWVINAAAYTAVDRAEQEHELADSINHLAPKAMAEACRESGCPMIHYSTDYVFDGECDVAYSEDDQTNPQSVYGRSKLAGEQAVSWALSDSIILRTAWVYSKEGANFVNTMLRLGGQTASLNIVNDQFGSPTLAEDLAAATSSIVEQTQRAQVSEVAGIYHATGAGQTNWFEFAQKIFSLTNNTEVKLYPVPTSAYPTAAKRPQFSVLSNQKLRTTFGIALPQWEDSLAKTLS